MKTISLMRLGCAFAALAAVPTMAVAQDQDVLIMKRAVSQPRAVSGGLKPVAGADMNTPHWEVGDWISGAPACSSTATQTRDRACVSNGAKVPDEQCAVPVPATSQTYNDTRACSYSWVMSPAGPWAAQCTNTTRPVSVTCAREGGSAVADVYCSGQTKPTSESGFNAAGCATQWAYGEYGEWSSTCSPSATRDRNITCEQIQPDKTVTVDNSKCSVATKGPAQETLGVYSGCTPSWKYGEWGWNGVDGAGSSTCSATPQQTRTATCSKLTATGQEIRPDAECGAKQAVTQNGSANYSSCSYAWVNGPWTNYDSTCSDTAKRTRVNTCKRSDGTTMPDNSRCDPNDTENAKTEETKSIHTDCGGMLINSGFESGLSNWNYPSWYSSYFSTVSDSKSGTKALKILSGNPELTQAGLVIPSGTNMRLTFWCKSDGNNTSVTMSIKQSGQTIGGKGSITCSTSSYEFKSYTFKTTNQATNGVFYISANTIHNIYIDDIELKSE